MICLPLRQRWFPSEELYSLYEYFRSHPGSLSSHTARSSPFLKSSFCMLRVRRASLHLLSGTNCVCAVADDFVSRLEITEDLYIAVCTQTSDHIHPFRLPIAYSLNEGALLVIGYCGNRHKHGWSSAMDRPLHTS